MTREELSQMVELLRDMAKLHQPNEEILTNVKAEGFIFVMDSVLSALSVSKREKETVRERIKQNLSELAQYNADMLKAFNAGKELAEKEKREWIPVSEKSPEKSGKYWCTFGGTYLTGIDYYTTESDAKELFDDWKECIGWQSQNVIAWTPLLEPYKAESEEV